MYRIESSHRKSSSMDNINSNPLDQSSHCLTKEASTSPSPSQKTYTPTAGRRFSRASPPARGPRPTRTSPPRRRTTSPGGGRGPASSPLCPSKRAKDPATQGPALQGSTTTSATRYLSRGASTRRSRAEAFPLGVGSARLERRTSLTPTFDI